MKVHLILMQSEYAISDRFFRFENPMAQVVRFWPKIRRLGSSDFQIEKCHGLYCKFKMLSTTASSSRRTIDEFDTDTAVKRRCFAPDAKSAGGPSLRGQTAVG